MKYHLAGAQYLSFMYIYSLCIKQLYYKDLPYSPGNYIQYLVITINRKDSQKKCIYIYV